MPSTIDIHTTPQRFRRMAALLLALSIGFPIFVGLIGGPDWLGGVVGLVAFFYLIPLTYVRLGDAALAPTWIIFMVPLFNHGPSWDVPGPGHFYLLNLLASIPLLLGWFVPTNGGANPRRLAATHS